MRIFGHRGAAGLGLENSIASVHASLQSARIEAAEFDIHRTSDGQLVIIHDHDTGRVASQAVSVYDTPLDVLQAIPLNNGQHILSLDELCAIVGNTKPLILDVKDGGCAGQILLTLERHPEVTAYVTSFDHDTLRHIVAARPAMPTYTLMHLRPFKIITAARHIGTTGISLNVWLMNPLTYYLTRRHNLELLVYTVNSPLLMRVLHRLYPGITLYTDYPDRVPAALQSGH